MKDIPRRDVLTRGAAAIAGVAAMALTASGSPAAAASGGAPKLKRYVIERDVPGIGLKTAQEYCDIARTSDNALAQLAPAIQWQLSYITDNKTFCIYLAEDEAAIRRHSELSGFPANKITLIDCIIDPATATDKVRA